VKGDTGAVNELGGDAVALKEAHDKTCIFFLTSAINMVAWNAITCAKVAVVEDGAGAAVVKSGVDHLGHAGEVALESKAVENDDDGRPLVNSVMGDEQMHLHALAGGVLGEEAMGRRARVMLGRSVG
jgi:hypothetical protein